MKTYVGTVSGVQQSNIGTWTIQVTVPELERRYSVQTNAIQIVCDQAMAMVLAQMMVSQQPITITLPAVPE